MESLKGTYRCEKTRIKKSFGTGKGRKDIYQSKWFAFESLQFLDDKDEPQMTLDNLNTNEDETSNEAEGDGLREDTEEGERDPNDEEETASEDPISARKEFKSPAKRPKSNRSRGNKDNNGDQMIAEAFGYLRQTAAAPKQQKDQCSLFGDYIADKLRTFDPRLRAIAQQRISNTIFDLEMKLYQQFPQHSQTGQFYPSPSSVSPQPLQFQQIIIPGTSTPQNSGPSLSSSPVSVISSPETLPSHSQTHTFYPSPTSLSPQSPQFHETSSHNSDPSQSPSQASVINSSSYSSPHTSQHESAVSTYFHSYSQ